MEEREYDRLKELVDSGRKFHYRNFIFSGLIVALLLKDKEDNLSLFLEIEFPIKFLLLFLYLVTLAYTAITIDILTSVWETQNYFRGQIPFNWFVLSKDTPFSLAYFWVIFPLLLSLVIIGFSDLGKIISFLIMFALFVLTLPFYLKRFSNNIINKKDDDGNKITLSIFFLYWYRLARSIMIIILLGLALPILFNGIPFLRGSENAEQFDLNAFPTHPLFILWISIEGIRFIWNLKFIYKRLDNFGTRWGFAREYIKK